MATSNTPDSPQQVPSAARRNPAANPVASAPSAQAARRKRVLSDTEEAILRFADETVSLRPGRREQRIVQQLGMQPWAYYQRLNALLDDPAALAAFPSVVLRQQRIRQQRMTR